MSKSYQYTKGFIDQQVKALNSPLTLDSEIEDILQKETNVSKSIFKCNVLVRRYNRNKYQSQAINQIIQQVLKNETSKLVKVNESFIKIHSILKIILIPENISDDNLPGKLKLFNQLINELPQLKYLIINEVPNETVDEFNTQLSNYEDIRKHLIELNEVLLYKYDKLTYLKNLKLKLSSYTNPKDIQPNLIMSNDHLLYNEINRFRVLVEKLSYKLSENELTDILNKLQD